MTEARVAPGTVLAGRYRVDRLVAEGGYGSVYAGHHLVLDGPVAIKVLRPDRDAPRHVAGFLEEARTLARLRHPNIVSVLDAGVLPDGAVPWIALEWCDGPTLQRALASGEVACPMSPRAAWELLRPVASAIAYAHGSGIAHRDLKPSNVMLARHGTALVPRVLDFGLAKTAEDAPLPSGDTHTREPSAFTPTYASPEQVTASRTGPWTDVHSLGLLFVELVTGRPPYGEENPLERAVSPERPTPRAFGVEVGDTLEGVLARALALKSGARFQSAAELISAVDAALGEGVAAFPSPPSRRSLATPDARPESAAPSNGMVDAAVATQPTGEARADLTGLGAPSLRPAGAHVSENSAAPATPQLAATAAAAPAHLAPDRGSAVQLAGTGATPTHAAAASGPAEALHDSPRRSRRQVAAVLVACAAAAAIAGLWQLGRGTLSAGGTDWRVQDGSWREEDGALIGSGGQLMSDAELRDGTFEVDFEPIEMPASGTTIGIGFRAQPVLERELGSGYGVNFGLGETIRFQVFEGANGAWRPVDPAFPRFRPSPALRSGKNRVAVTARGDTFEIHVNGEPLARFVDDTYAQGRVTLWVQNRTARVRFSNIQLR